jgi:hypothetical protein
LGRPEEIAAAALFLASAVRTSERSKIIWDTSLLDWAFRQYGSGIQRTNLTHSQN